MALVTASSIHPESTGKTDSNTSSTDNFGDKNTDGQKKVVTLKTANVPAVQETKAMVNSTEMVRGKRFSEKCEPIIYSWTNIKVSVGPEPVEGCVGGGRDPEKGCCGCRKIDIPKDILHSVTGVAKPFELLALMGASGAGKTTLLNTLTFRNVGGLRISGERFANGKQLNREMMSAISAYIQQDDLFIGTLTVREHLRFQARVRMHKYIPMDQRLKRVEEVIEELGLSKCADTTIGIPGRKKGISGGQMKRLSFASEVLTDPPLMFCDEPTSGLDAYMAQNVIDVLRQLAGKGKTIICTIHQPSSQVFAMFDRILLMAEGRTAFLGDTVDALNFFESVGSACPANFNPADFYIQTLAVDPHNQIESRELLTKICDAYDSSDAAVSVKKAIEEAKTRFSSLSGVDIAHLSPYKASWCKQFTACLWRSWIAMIRDPQIFTYRLGVNIAVGFLLGFIYLRQELNQKAIQNLNGALYICLTTITFHNVFAVVNGFCMEMPIFLREHFNAMYRVDTYFIAKTMAEFPQFVLIPFVFATITYWMVGFADGWDRYLIFCGIIILIANVGCSFGYMVSCLAPDLHSALNLGPVLIVPSMLFGGFFLNSGSSPIYFIWLKNVSWFLFGNEALAINQWKDVKTIKCKSNVTCIRDGMAVLHMLDFDKENILVDIAALLVLMTAFRFLAFLFLLIRTYLSK